MPFGRSIFRVEPLGAGVSLYLDVLRTIFSQLVLIGHGASFFGVMLFLHPSNFARVQSIAVVGFFWLSGFLICHSTLMRKQKAASYNFSTYFVDRFARIYSGYVPAILFVFFVGFVFIRIYPENYGFYGSFSLNAAIKNLFMLQKIPIDSLTSPMFGSGSTWWTLGIEWWLYMFFGWVFVKRHSLKLDKSYLGVGLLVLLSLLPLHYFSVKHTAFLGFGLSFVWFLACGVAILKDIVCAFMPRKMMLLNCILLTVLTVTRYKLSLDAYDLIAAVCFGGAFLFSVCWLQGIKAGIAPFLKKIIHFTAGYSFTLFLTHYSILYFIYANELLSGWIAFFVSFVVSNLVAALIAMCSEMHYRSLALYIKKRWLYTSKEVLN